MGSADNASAPADYLVAAPGGPQQASGLWSTPGALVAYQGDSEGQVTGWRPPPVGERARMDHC